MKRGGPLRRGKGLRRKSRPRVSGAEKLSHQLFREAARKQLVCAGCGKRGAFDPHHVIEMQYLKANGLPRFDTRNALRLCPDDCHAPHTNRSKRLALTKLRDENIRYAFYLLGPRAYDYLRRHYGGEDQRVELALQELEEAA